MKENYKVLGEVIGLKNNEVLKQGYRLVEFTRNGKLIVGVEQQFSNGKWDLTQGQWLKEDVIEKNSIAIDFGQNWGVTEMQKVFNK